MEFDPTSVVVHRMNKDPGADENHAVFSCSRLDAIPIFLKTLPTTFLPYRTRKQFVAHTDRRTWPRPNEFVRTVHDWPDKIDYDVGPVWNALAVYEVRAALKFRVGCFRYQVWKVHPCTMPSAPALLHWGPIDSSNRNPANHNPIRLACSMAPYIDDFAVADGAVRLDTDAWTRIDLDRVDTVTREAVELLLRSATADLVRSAVAGCAL